MLFCYLQKTGVVALKFILSLVTLSGTVLHFELFLYLQYLANLANTLNTFFDSKKE